MRELIAAFVAAVAAGQGTDAMVLDAIHMHMGIATFEQLRDIVARIRDARFHQCVPWTTSYAHFEVGAVCDTCSHAEPATVQEPYLLCSCGGCMVEADEVRYVSCRSTVVRLSRDGCFAIEDIVGAPMPEDYYRCLAAAPHVRAYVEGL